MYRSEEGRKETVYPMLYSWCNRRDIDGCWWLAKLLRRLVCWRQKLGAWKVRKSNADITHNKSSNPRTGQAIGVGVAVAIEGLKANLTVQSRCFHFLINLSYLSGHSSYTPGSEIHNRAWRQTEYNRAVPIASAIRSPGTYGGSPIRLSARQKSKISFCP